jgi:hypothetical protein
MLTPLAVSIRRGHHQAAQVLRELERTARARKEAAEHANAGSVETTAAASQAGVCAACGSSSGASDAPLKTCSRCQSVKYCSALCQRTHWPAHKASCAAAAAAGSGGGASTTQAGGRAGTPAAGTLHLAAGHGDVTEVRRLAAMGVNLEERFAAGFTALHLAAFDDGQVEVLRVLVEVGADIEARDATGSTPLHQAAGNGHVEAIKALVELGAQIDAQAANGDTPSDQHPARSASGGARRGQAVPRGGLPQGG